MSGITSLVRAHAGAIVASIFVGLVIIAPQLVFIHSLGSSYKGIYMLNTDAELHYVARMEEAIKGEGIGNPFVIEYRNNVPSAFYSYTEEILTLPARIVPVSAPTLNLFYKFLLPALLALLAYAFSFRLTQNKGWSIVGAVTLVIGSTALNAFTVLTMIHFNLWYQQFLLFSRPVNPIFSLIVFFVFLHVLLTADRKKNLQWFIALGLVFGLSWYVYIYLATTILALVAVYVSLNLVVKKTRPALLYGVTLVSGLLVGAPGILSIVSIAHSPYYSLFEGPVGLMHTHMPYVHIPWIIVTGLFLFWWYTHRPYQYAPILFGLLIASCLVVNQQILTGLSLHPAHYITYFCIPIYILVLSILGYEFFSNRSSWFGRAVQMALLGYVVLAGVFIQYSSYTYWMPRIAAEQRDAAVLSWLQTNTPKDSVIMADQSLSELIPAYTADNVMWEDHAIFYLMPESRSNFTPANALAAKDFCSFVAHYRLDYIIWDKTNEDWKTVATESCVRPVTEVNGFTIYAIQK